MCPLIRIVGAHRDGLSERVPVPCRGKHQDRPGIGRAEPDKCRSPAQCGGFLRVDAQYLCAKLCRQAADREDAHESGRCGTNSRQECRAARAKHATQPPQSPFGGRTGVADPQEGSTVASRALRPRLSPSLPLSGTPGSMISNRSAAASNEQRPRILGQLVRPATDKSTVPRVNNDQPP